MEAAEPRLFMTIQACSTESQLPPTQKNQIVRMFHGQFQAEGKKYLEEAVTRAHGALCLQESADTYAAITHNALRGARPEDTSLLKIEDTKCQSVHEFKQRLVDLLRSRCPMIDIRPYEERGRNIAEEHQQSPAIRVLVN